MKSLPRLEFDRPNINILAGINSPIDRDPERNQLRDCFSFDFLLHDFGQVTDFKLDQSGDSLRSPAAEVTNSWLGFGIDFQLAAHTDGIIFLPLRVGQGQ